MTDRQPGAPGQYRMTPDASTVQKFLTGETITVTLERDDQPVVEGTPYNKASVLPDELAKVLCPDILDPTPADALGALYKAQEKNGEIVKQNKEDIKNIKEKEFKKLLWRNASPGSTFAEQEIVFDYTGYSLLLIYANADTNTDTRVFVVADAEPETRYRISYITNSFGSYYSRTIAVTETGLRISDGNASGETNNNRCIPVEVYGLG